MLTAAVVAVPIGLALTVDRYTYDIWGAFIWGPVLLLVALPICRWAAKRAEGLDVLRFLMAAAVLKVVVGAVARYSSAQVFYGGLADAARYDNAGATLAPLFRRGNFDDLGHISGTRFIEIVSGLVQAVIGDTRMGTFLVFSFFGFVGLLLFYVALCDALPDGDHRLYRRLLFLTPTMWFWPSSIGKEAVMLLCLGAATYGVVQGFRGRIIGLPVAALGIWGSLVVRPHLTLVFFVGLALAIPGLSRRTASGLRRFLVPVLLLLTLPLVVHQVESFFKIDQLNADTAESVLNRLEVSNDQAGSRFKAPDTGNPAGFAMGVVTVFGRPFPWEASNFTSLLSGIEIGALCLFFGWRCLRSRAALIAALRLRLPRLALGYVLAFSAAFAAVGNFGILVRQRSLVLPFAFMLFAAAAVTQSAQPEQPSVSGRRARPTSRAR